MNRTDLLVAALLVTVAVLTFLFAHAIVEAATDLFGG